MIVYYVAKDEKPENAENVKFFTDHASAMSAASETRCSIYQFEVNEKCDTNSFGLDTQMVFNKDSETGELKFLASGRWVELHDIMNIPFYYDFEAKAKNFVSMSLRYFLDHYQVVERKKKRMVQDPEPKWSEVKPAVSVAEEKSEVTLENNASIDDLVLKELFGGF